MKHILTFYFSVSVRMYINFSKIFLYLDIFVFFPSSHLTFPWPGQESLVLESKWMKLQTCCQSCGLCSPIHKASPGRSRGGCSMCIVEICVFLFIIWWGGCGKSSIPRLCTWQAGSKQPCATVNCHCLSTEKKAVQSLQDLSKRATCSTWGWASDRRQSYITCLNNTKSPK